MTINKIIILPIIVENNFYLIYYLLNSQIFIYNILGREK